MVDVATKFCSTCGEPLGDVIYTEHCGPHLIADFVQEWGYVVDVGDLYGDWNSPDYFVIPIAKRGGSKRIWAHKDGCCYWREKPEGDDQDYCRICQDVMKPTPSSSDGGSQA